MKNFIQQGVNLTISASESVLAGEVVIVGEIHGIASNNAAESQPVDIVTEGVFELSKVAADSFSTGDPVYYDATEKLVTSTATDNTLIGVAVTAAAADGASVNVKLI